MHIFFYILMALVLLPHSVQAAGAGLEMPTERIVFEKGKETHALVLRNSGDAAGAVSVQLLDMKMLENGVIVPSGPGEAAPMSALSLFSVKPVDLLLKPGETAQLELLLNKPAALAEGEYRTHLKVTMATADPLPPGTAASDTGTRTSFAMIVPVIARQGSIPPAAVRVEAPALSRGPDGTSLSLTLIRTSGSPLGEISVDWQPPAGKPRPLATAPRIAIYPPLKQRSVVIPFSDIPEDIDLATGALLIRYAAAKEDGGYKMAEAVLPLATESKEIMEPKL